MADPFLSEIRIFSFNFAPQGWAMCNGQFLPINQNQALFSLLGTTYGGNGQTTFALPDLRGRAPIHFGNSITLGERAGEENHTITQGEMPAHTHTVTAIAPGNGGSNVNNPSGAFLSNSAPAEIYGNAAGSPGLLALNPAAISSIGGSQAHNNMQPSLTLNLCIALQGIFPSRN